MTLQLNREKQQFPTTQMSEDHQISKTGITGRTLRIQLIQLLAPKIFINISQTPKMSQQKVVSMTGFVSDPQQQNYKKMISDLGFRLASTLSEQTSVLIVNDVTTEKYKIAKNYDTPISTVTVDWLLDCKKKNKLLPVENYLIKKIFHGAHIKIIDFQQDKSRKLEAKISENGGIVKTMKSVEALGQLIDKGEKISVLIISNESFSKLKAYIEDITFPIVGLEWLQHSLKTKICKYPFDYALNQHFICSRAAHEHSKRMKSKLQNMLALQPDFKHQKRYLEDTIIHIAQNVNPDLTQILKKLIMILGGYYLDTSSPVVTHILTQPLSEVQYLQLIKYGSLTQVIRVQWLIDSIYLGRKMNEEDYSIRCYKARSNTAFYLEDYANNQNSTSFNSFGGSLPTLLHRKSISVLNTGIKKVPIIKKVNNTIFKQWKFYIQSSQKKQIQMTQLANKIRSHGGTLFQSRAHIEKGHCFYILKDSSQCTKMIERLKSDTKGQVQIQPASYRWINDCVSKCQYIDILKSDSYVFKPFNFKTPIMGFHKMVFEVLGVDDVMKLRLKELYNILGSVKNSPNRVQMTHCLCGQKYQQNVKYREIIKENSSVKFISWKWLIECVNIGKIIDCKKFLLQKQGPFTKQQPQRTKQEIIPQQLTNQSTIKQ